MAGSKIRLLDEKTINQIAAGEVIENPASVVKELVDNAIDAGSTKIVVEAVNSGRQLIRVQDNGHGMNHDDALLCIERHATSKIRSVEDLWSLATMGFRGEALSSIASVSECTLLTAPQSDGLTDGSRVSVSGGKILSHERLKCLSGTTIEVKSLFFNVPARKKFLKSPAKDATDICKVMQQLALSHPHVAFELILNHTKEFSFKASSCEERIKDVLGKEFFSELLPLTFQHDDLILRGFISKPSYSRPTRASQHLFVNNRPVQSLALSHAVKDAYGSSIDPQRHPAFVLFVDIAKSALDVNVHPQKREVRFSFEDELKQLIVQAVSAALFTRHVPVQTVQMSRPVHYEAPIITPAPPQVAEQMILIEEHAKVLAVFDDFIIADVEWKEPLEDGLSVISIKRALARLTHDGQSGTKSVSSQTLLVPIFIECNAEEANRLREKLPQLEKAGIVLSDFGRSSFLIQAIPSYLESSMVEDMIKAMLVDDSHNLADSLAKACKSVQKHKTLSPDAALQVIKKLRSCDNPYICPAGDKIVTILTATDLEKKFK